MQFMNAWGCTTHSSQNIQREIKKELDAERVISVEIFIPEDCHQLAFSSNMPLWAHTHTRSTHAFKINHARQVDSSMQKDQSFKYEESRSKNTEYQGAWP
jgi:hypothetical protein